MLLKKPHRCEVFLITLKLSLIKKYFYEKLNTKKMVKKIILLICLFLYANTFSQINAVTETGEPVILYKNNTWKYANKEDKKEKRSSYK